MVRNPILFIAGIVLSSCSRGGPDRATLQGHSLPAIASTGACVVTDQAPEPIAACAWATAPDALVLGTVVEVGWTDEPFVIQAASEGTYTVGSSCPGIVQGTLALKVDVVEALRGSVSGRIKVHFGLQAIRRWSPAPAHDGTAITWIGGDASASIRVGDMLGLPLYYIQEMGAWSVLGDVMFISYGSDVYFQESRAECEPPLDPQLATASLPQLRSVVRGCAQEAGAARRSDMRQAWQQREDFYALGICVQTAPPPGSGACGSSADCPIGTLCQQGECK